jgi:hypothetical protein
MQRTMRWMLMVCATTVAMFCLALGARAQGGFEAILIGSPAFGAAGEGMYTLAAGGGSGVLLQGGATLAVNGVPFTFGGRVFITSGGSGVEVYVIDGSAEGYDVTGATVGAGAGQRLVGSAPGTLPTVDNAAAPISVTSGSGTTLEALLGDVDAFEIEGLSFGDTGLSAADAQMLLQMMLQMNPDMAAEMDAAGITEDMLLDILQGRIPPELMALYAEAGLSPEQVAQMFGSGFTGEMPDIMIGIPTVAAPVGGTTGGAATATPEASSGVSPDATPALPPDTIVVEEVPPALDTVSVGGVPIVDILVSGEVPPPSGDAPITQPPQEPQYIIITATPGPTAAPDTPAEEVVIALSPDQFQDGVYEWRAEPFYGNCTIAGSSTFFPVDLTMSGEAGRAVMQYDPDDGLLSLQDPLLGNLFGRFNPARQAFDATQQVATYQPELLLVDTLVLVEQLTTRQVDLTYFYRFSYEDRNCLLGFSGVMTWIEA